MNNSCENFYHNLHPLCKQGTAKELLRIVYSRDYSFKNLKGTLNKTSSKWIRKFLRCVCGGNVAQTTKAANVQNSVSQLLVKMKIKGAFESSLVLEQTVFIAGWWHLYSSSLLWSIHPSTNYEPRFPNGQCKCYSNVFNVLAVTKKECTHKNQNCKTWKSQISFEN